jgi:hypothetical protein
MDGCANRRGQRDDKGVAFAGPNVISVNYVSQGCQIFVPKRGKRWYNVHVSPADLSPADPSPGDPSPGDPSPDDSSRDYLSPTAIRRRQSVAGNPSPAIRRRQSVAHL